MPRGRPAEATLEGPGLSSQEEGIRQEEDPWASEEAEVEVRPTARGRCSAGFVTHLETSRSKVTRYLNAPDLWTETGRTFKVRFVD